MELKRHGSLGESNLIIKRGKIVTTHSNSMVTTPNTQPHQLVCQFHRMTKLQFHIQMSKIMSSYINCYCPQLSKHFS